MVLGHEIYGCHGDALFKVWLGYLIVAVVPGIISLPLALALLTEVKTL